eukprot:7000072-Pyramimonas_sp.AAC.1
MQERPRSSPSQTAGRPASWRGSRKCGRSPPPSPHGDRSASGASARARACPPRPASKSQHDHDGAALTASPRPQ